MICTIVFNQQKTKTDKNVFKTKFWEGIFLKELSNFRSYSFLLVFRLKTVQYYWKSAFNLTEFTSIFFVFCILNFKAICHPPPPPNAIWNNKILNGLCYIAIFLHKWGSFQSSVTDAPKSVHHVQNFW